MTLELHFQLTLYSDYHVSAGHGLGDAIDSALQRDLDGVPVLRGTTVTGLLRDGLRQLPQTPRMAESQHVARAPVVLTRDDDPDQDRPIVNRLFGSANSPKRWAISSARPIDAATPQSGTFKGGSVAAAHVRVDPATRRAEARKLFVREEGDQSWTFGFTATCDARDEHTMVEAALLTAAARMVQHLGAQRRRGRGRCTIRLDKVDGWNSADAHGNDAQSALLALFQSYWLDGGKPVRLEPLPASTEYPPPTKDDDCTLRVLLLLRTEEPLLISRRAAAGNEYEGIDYIPGSVLRGVLATRIAQRQGLTKNGAESPDYAEFVRLFFRNGVRFGHCLPGFAKGLRGNVTTFVPAIPAPMDLFVSELHPQRAGKQLTPQASDATDPGMGPLTARQAAAQDFRHTVAAQDLKLETVHGYLGVEAGLPLVRTVMRNEMHVRINPQTGRAKDENLFGFTALASGQYFLGEIQCADVAAWETMCRLAGLPPLPASDDGLGYRISEEFDLRMGKARRRGYGKVKGVLIAMPQPDPWNGLPLASRVSSVTEPLTMTLLSDAILLDPWGRARQGFDEEWLADLFASEEVAGVEICEEHGHRLAFARNRTVDGFNNQLGLPRHRDLALAAGSAVTLRLHVTESLTVDALRGSLAKLERKGIGLRRDEGFGRVVFNHPLYTDACSAVNESSFSIPKCLRLHHDIGQTLPALTAAWDRTWQEMLGKPPLEPSFAHFGKPDAGHYAGLVRELGVITSQAAAQTLLADYGVPEKDALFGSELSGRTKTRFYAPDGNAALQFLSEMLTKTLPKHVATGVEDGLDADDLWRRGCIMLAERIAKEVKAADGLIRQPAWQEEKQR